MDRIPGTERARRRSNNEPVGGVLRCTTGARLIDGLRGLVIDPPPGVSPLFLSRHVSALSAAAAAEIRKPSLFLFLVVAA